MLRNLVFESREQTRTVVRSVTLLETDPVDVAVGSSTRLPVLVPGETAQNIVKTPTVLKRVESSHVQPGVCVHRPCHLPSQNSMHRKTASPSQNL